jgi:hypothetical protein
VTRFTTPLDDFLADVGVWLDQPWYVWMAVAVTVCAIIAVPAVLKWRNRVHARTPHYKRQRY